MFGRMSDNDINIYLISSDQNLLSVINRMLKRKGILGVSDATGRIHFVVDARKNVGFAARQIEELLNLDLYMSQDKSADVYSDDMYEIVKIATAKVLSDYNFNLALTGSKSLIYLIKLIIFDERNNDLRMKELFSKAAEVTNLSYYQIERNIRYAIKMSDFPGEYEKTSSILRILTEEVRKKIYVIQNNKKQAIK